MRIKLSFESVALLLLVAVLSGCSDDPTDPVGTPCEGYTQPFPQYDDQCSGNHGCSVSHGSCGACACTMCLDESCRMVECNDGGTPECPGSPWDYPPSDTTEADTTGDADTSDLGDVEVQSDSVDAETDEPQDLSDGTVEP